MSDAGTTGAPVRRRKAKPIAPDIVREVRTRIERGHTPEQIVAWLGTQGVKPKRALRLVGRVEDNVQADLGEMERMAAHSGARRHNARTVTGAVIALLGIGVTLATYSSASQTGGSYVVAYGAIIGGAVMFFRGLASSD